MQTHVSEVIETATILASVCRRRARRVVVVQKFTRHTIRRTFFYWASSKTKRTKKGPWMNPGPFVGFKLSAKPSLAVAATDEAERTDHRQTDEGQGRRFGNSRDRDQEVTA